MPHAMLRTSEDIISDILTQLGMPGLRRTDGRSYKRIQVSR
jgi:hypothetical protein